MMLLIAGAAGGYFTHLFDESRFAKEFDTTVKARLDNEFNKIIDYDLQYPYFSDTNFISRVNRSDYHYSDSLVRYTDYCDYIFNYLQSECEYFHYDTSKIEKDVDVPDLIALHKDWWNSPKQNNSKSYPREFRKFVNAHYQ